jgi:hypothetical protein
LMIDSAGLQAAYITNDANSVGERDQLLIKRRILFPITFNTGNFIPACFRLKTLKGIMICSCST